MFITNVISYGDAWDTLNKNYSEIFEELHNIIDQITIPNIQEYENIKGSIVNGYSIRRYWRSNMKLRDWMMISHTKNYSNHDLSLLGFLKNNISLNFFNDPEVINRWLYSITPIAYKNGSLSIPIAVVPIPATFIDVEKVGSKSALNNKVFTQIYLDLNNLEPLDHNVPFLILGVGSNETEFDVREISSVKIEKINLRDIRIDRCIEFSPEYYQAGLAILTYFGSVLREKYPEQNATVKIEQHDLTVRMIIETEDGNIETLEKALHEYELVLKGQKSAEEFYLSPIKALELKNQLHLFKFQIESQKEIIALQRGQILSLEDIVDKALAPITHPPVTIINQLNNTQSLNMNHQTTLNQSYDDLDELIDLADKDSLKKRLERALTALDAAQNLDEPEEVKNSGGMKQLAKILNEANEIGSEVNDLVEKGGQAVELIKNLGRKYNSVAEWCGLPVIPSVFVKE
ncbi:hypothetical protein [Acinetobacter sp. ANC 4648]|uniref:hypothetical protein n=1 Tax=Acinetobacter sp. ANC 4648 TaxID=1977875 RepID=UPI000A32F5D5|nr:hypothetical protein [Acinetobacter sp. ANC 4648]OTG83552.1 hypothetical protein B9T27_03275 [Acinetobacter sp. ANC 4648]